MSQQKSTVKNNINTTSHTFKVSDIEKSNKLLPSFFYYDIIKKKTVDAVNEVTTSKYRGFRQKIIQPEPTPSRTLEAAPKKYTPLVYSGFHPFVAALHHAYSEHYPITISPDMIWLLIAQGFANHINENGDAMRSYFVDFEGKKNLDVRRDNFAKGSPNNDWQGVFAEFGVQIEENTGTDLLELITGDFSTTTAIEKVAFQVTLMDAMKSYFDYSLTTRCGIPDITLEGSVEDWQLIETKAQALAQYDLKYWIDGLMPILQEFTAAAEGKVDKGFWKSIYKCDGGSGGPYITGWILKFFPYTVRRNDKLTPFAVKPKEPAPDKNNKHSSSVTTGQFPSGLSRVDFIWSYLDIFYSMEFVAGFVGFHQDTKTLSLRPEISWAVIDKNEKPSEERIENYRKGGDEDYLKSVGKQ